jgi:hypothetical protein
MLVVVPDVDPHDLLQMPWFHDQEPVQALGTARADLALGGGVCVGCLHRREEDLGALGAEHLVEPAAEQPPKRR